MRSKKFAFVLILGFVFLGAWIFCLKKASGIEEINRQKELVEQAKVYIDKELYVRGIPLLEEALAIKTDQELNIQKELLNAYQKYGDMDSYYAMVQIMDKKDQASAADYLKMAEYDVEMQDIEDALKVAQTGLKQHEDEELRKLYEKYRYEYTISQTEYQKILSTKDSSYMPAYDGQSWNYVDGDGREEFHVESNVITSFNDDGKAVVKWNGKFCVILKNGDLYGIDETGVDEVLGITDRYIIAKKQNLYGFYDFDFQLLSKEYQYENMTLNNCGVIAVEKDGQWGIISDSGEQITKYIYDDVAVNSLGQAFAGDRAMVEKDGKWIMIDTEGNEISNAVYANAKAPESGDYIAVANENGKWGFVNLEGKQIIDFQYRDAKSFSCGLAAVQVINDWGYISSLNNLVIEDSYREAEPFQNGYAVVSNVIGSAVLELSYYELED